MISKIKKELRALANPKKESDIQKFFKTGIGEYGEGDQFIAVTVPEQRRVAKKYLGFNLAEAEELLQHKVHEFRSVALIILVEQFKKADEKQKKQIYDLYLKNTAWINNWDLVDLSSHKIVGEYLLDKDRKVLYKLAKSKLLWDRRIAIVSTFAFIRKNDFCDTIELAEMLLKDEHDLMHKAVGWMLREMGKKSEENLTKFLDKYTLKMPRTMLRYAIERLEEKKRLYYLNFK